MVLDRGGCEEVEVIVDHSFSIISSGQKLCCFELMIKNEFMVLDVFDNLMITSKVNDEIYFGSGEWSIQTKMGESDYKNSIFRTSDFTPIPNTESDLLPFLNFCYPEESIPQEEDFLLEKW